MKKPLTKEEIDNLTDVQIDEMHNKRMHDLLIECMNSCEYSGRCGNCSWNPTR